jgi:hypothetical protein
MPQYFNQLGKLSANRWSSPQEAVLCSDEKPGSSQTPGAVQKSRGKSQSWQVSSRHMKAAVYSKVLLDRADDAESLLDQEVCEVWICREGTPDGGQWTWTLVLTYLKF